MGESLKKQLRKLYTYIVKLYHENMDKMQRAYEHEKTYKERFFDVTVPLGKGD